MKKFTILFTMLATLFFGGCGTSSQNSDSSIAILQPSGATLNPYQMYVEEMLYINRAKAFRLYEDVVDEDPISGKHLDELHEMILRYLATKDTTADYVEKYQYLVDDSDEKYTEKERFELVMISLSAMLIRYDDYLLTYKNYNDDSKLRQFLNDADSGYEIEANTFNEIVNQYNSISDRSDIKDMIDFYDNNIGTYADENGAFFVYLKNLIESSPSYQAGLGGTTEITTLTLASLYLNTEDIGDDALDALLNTISKDFGNTAGLVATREGKLYEDASVAANIRATIQPGDILLEKTPFRLTDQLIPGHWGHAAVYIGTDDELETLGIWDELANVQGFSQERIDAIRQEIRDGKVIDEALRDGVQLNTIEHFLNIDDLAIMHDTTETSENRNSRIILTLRQLGKDYDFEFDIETSVKIVCSELIYATFILNDWDTDSTVGINTISPDNVAVKLFDENSTFTLPLLYHDGEEITTDRLAYMAGLLDGSIE